MRTVASLSIPVVLVLFACGRTKGSGAEPPKPAAAPSISPGTGTFSTPVDATVSCPTGGTLPYATTDGATPSTSSAQTATATFIASGTLKAICAGAGYTDSAVASATYTITGGTAGTAMTTAHRTGGVAPLAVFFDAIDDVTTSGAAPTFAWSSGVFQPADREGAMYAWDFGDPGAGTWSTTGLSRNAATGFTAAHVFEAPGTYVVRLTLADAGGAVRSYAQTITVADPATVFASTTRYVAGHGSDGNPGTQAAPYATLGKAMADVASGAAKRVLLRRGDTFTAPTAYAITSPGPGLIGAYGSGDRPVLNVTYTGELSVFSPRGAGADWRVMDLELRGPGTDHPTGSVGPPAETAATDVLALRLKLTADTWGVSLGWGDWWPGNPAGYQLSDGMFVVECEAPNAGSYAYYVGARRLALLGNVGSDSQRTHVARMWLGHKAVVSNNHFLRCQAQRHELKIHGAPADGRPDTRWITITDNRFDASAVSQWSLAIGPQDNASDEAISHVLIERNRFSSGAASANSIEVNASYSMIRNNLFDFTGSPSYGSAALIWRRGVEPIPTTIRAFNNTCYKTISTTDTLMFDVRAPVVNAEVRNNLGVAWTSTAGWRTVQNSTATGWVQSNNLLVTQGAVTSVTGGDLTLAAGSPAIDAGAALPQVTEDFARGARPAGAGHDVGAFESR